MNDRAFANPVEPRPFMGHYVPWRNRRVLAIMEHYGRDWFRGRRVLDLGCGHGYLGVNFAMLGAEVTFCEGREKHLKELQLLWPAADNLVCANLEHEWPDGRFDLILHQGLLYHLTDWRFSIRQAAACADHMALETEVRDGPGELCLPENTDAIDTGIAGLGTRPSAELVEETLQGAGWVYKRLQDGRCNSGRHVYDWAVTNTGGRLPCHRRWWWCWKDAQT